MVVDVSGWGTEAVVPCGNPPAFKHNQEGYYNGGGGGGGEGRGVHICFNLVQQIGKLQTFETVQFLLAHPVHVPRPPVQRYNCRYGLISHTGHYDDLS